MRPGRWQVSLSTLMLLAAVVPPLAWAIWFYLPPLVMSAADNPPFVTVRTTVIIPDGGTTLTTGSGSRSVPDPYPMAEALDSFEE